MLTCRSSAWKGERGCCGRCRCRCRCPAAGTRCGLCGGGFRPKSFIITLARTSAQRRAALEPSSAPGLIVPLPLPWPLLLPWALCLHEHPGEPGMQCPQGGAA